MFKLVFMFAAVPAVLSMSTICNAALIVDPPTGPLHYESDVAFNGEFRLTSSNVGFEISDQSGLGDGFVLRSFNNNERRVYDAHDATSATDRSVFDLAVDEPLVMITDFRIPNVGNASRVALSAVSTNDTASYTGSFFMTGSAGGGNYEGLLRFENFDFTSTARNAAYTASGTSLTLASADWYQLEMQITRAGDDSVTLELSVYKLTDGDKGGARGDLVGSFSEVRASYLTDDMTDQVQFGLMADAGLNTRTHMDNFGVLVPEPGSAVLFTGAVLALMWPCRRRGAN